MKTIFAICILVSVSLMSELSLASGNFRVSIAPKTEDKSLLEISNNTDQKYEIILSNESGEVIYSHKTKGEHSKFNKVFDFSKSELGVYKLVVKRDGESNEQLLTVTKSGVQAGETIKKTDPIFSYRDNLLILAFQNHNNEELVFNLYQKDDLILSKKMKDTYNIKKGFDLSQLDKGEYSVVFSTEDEVYEYA
ncbi:MAG: hypothetical protein GZ094_24580, partial [Mariniphaga sp.]|nr:hypothetical protein [Mariniphaga sp.]